MAGAVAGKETGGAVGELGGAAAAVSGSVEVEVPMSRAATGAAGTEVADSSCVGCDLAGVAKGCGRRVFGCARTFSVRAAELVAGAGDTPRGAGNAACFAGDVIRGAGEVC